jgi:KAP family P-loop domain
VAAVLITEYWHWVRPRLSLGELKLNVPVTKSTVSAEQQWEARTADDPISEWEDDIVGRTAVVKLLAEHALRQRTPIVALRGGLGDGKSSVLNLLRRAVEDQAIVVSFNAWLPGSHATLAPDLFSDIAAECKKRFSVP